MKWIVILGRGGAGKSNFARRLGVITYRWYLPAVMARIATYLPGEPTHVVRTPRAAEEFLKATALG